MIKNKIPKHTFDAIKTHLTQNSKISERRWYSIKDEEDAGTGDFCGQLSSEWTKFNANDSRTGRWRINYRKFGSRKNSLEPLTGADGIFQIAIFNSFGEPIYRKGILFQAKKEPIKNKRELFEQIDKMGNFTSKKGNAVFVFGENGYYGMTGSKYKKNPVNRNFAKDDTIGNFLANEFMECNAGEENLYFPVKKDQLILPRKLPLSGELEHNMIIQIEQE